jgi:hypothetical protein
MSEVSFNRASDLRPFVTLCALRYALREPGA